MFTGPDDARALRTKLDDLTTALAAVLAVFADLERALEPGTMRPVARPGPGGFGGAGDSTSVPIYPHTPIRPPSALSEDGEDPPGEGEPGSPAFTPGEMAAAGGLPGAMAPWSAGPWPLYMGPWGWPGAAPWWPPYLAPWAFGSPWGAGGWPGGYGPPPWWGAPPGWPRSDGAAPEGAAASGADPAGEISPGSAGGLPARAADAPSESESAADAAQVPDSGRGTRPIDHPARWTWRWGRVEARTP